MPRVVRVIRALNAGYSAARRVQPPPTPHFGTGAAARIARAALVAGGVALLLVALDLPTILPSAWVPYFRLADAAVLLPVGLWLTVRARRKRNVRGFAMRMREWVLELAAIVMVAVGALQLGFGLHHFL